MSGRPHPLASPILLVLPADAGLMRLARLMASGIATNAGLPVDEVEDFRMAVDEVCTSLVEAAAEEGSITLRFSVIDESLVVAGDTGNSGQIDEARLSISREILGAITDEQQIGIDDETIWFRIARRLPAPQAVHAHRGSLRPDLPPSSEPR